MIVVEVVSITSSADEIRTMPPLTAADTSTFVPVETNAISPSAVTVSLSVTLAPVRFTSPSATISPLAPVVDNAPVAVALTLSAVRVPDTSIASALRKLTSPVEVTAWSRFSAFAVDTSVSAVSASVAPIAPVRSIVADSTASSKRPSVTSSVTEVFPAIDTSLPSCVAVAPEKSTVWAVIDWLISSTPALVTVRPPSAAWSPTSD